jgi:hypothetical protein
MSLFHTLTQSDLVQIMYVPFAEKSNNMGCVEYAATFGSIILLILTLPFSLFWCFKVRIFI